MTLTRKYTIFLGTILIAFVTVAILTPKPMDWSPSFSRYDDIPLGTSALAEVLPEVLPQKINVQKSPVFDALKQIPTHSNYINITASFDIEEPYLSRLLNYVSKGNTAFIAANSFGALADTLKFFIDSNSNYWKTGYQSALEDSTANYQANFTNPRLASRIDFPISEAVVPQYFSSEKKNLTALAFTRGDSLLYHFVKVSFGKGTFYLHCNPMVFSNYCMLNKKTQAYPFKALSYLPVQETYWEEKTLLGKGRLMKKSRHFDFAADEQGSSFRFLLSQPSLKAAYYLTLISIFLYIFFQGRRRQRIIPVLVPPTNTSLLFVQTVGNLYFNKGNHQDLAMKKIAHWYAFLRRKLYISTNDLNEEFKQELRLKTTMTNDEIEELCRYVAYVQQAKRLTPHELHYINNLIEGFYKKI